MKTGPARRHAARLCEPLVATVSANPVDSELEGSAFPPGSSLRGRSNSDSVFEIPELIQRPCQAKFIRMCRPAAVSV